MDDRGAEVFAALVALILRLSPFVIDTTEQPARKGLRRYRHGH